MCLHLAALQSPTCSSPSSLSMFRTAVQNERQPRNSAQVRQEQLEVGLEHPLAPTAATVSATHPAFVPAPPGHSPGHGPPPASLGHTFRPPGITAAVENSAKAADMDDRGKGMFFGDTCTDLFTSVKEGDSITLHMYEGVTIHIFLALTYTLI